MHPQHWPFTLQLFLDFCPNFFPERPLNFFHHDSPINLAESRYPPGHFWILEAKETFGDGCGRNYANSQSANHYRQDTITGSRVAAVQESAKSQRWMQWQSGGWNARHINSAGCQGMATTVTAALCPPLHLVWRHLYDRDSMHNHHQYASIKRCKKIDWCFF